MNDSSRFSFYNVSDNGKGRKNPRFTKRDSRREGTTRPKSSAGRYFIFIACVLEEGLLS